MYVQGNKVHGTFNKTATVTSNDPNNPNLTIAIAGDPRAYVEVTPTGRIYLQGRFGETVEKFVTISSNEEDKDFQILDVSSNMDDKITYKLVPGESPGQYVVKMWKNPQLPTMSHYGTLTIKTNSEHAPLTKVQVQVVTKGAITVQPATVNYGRVEFGSFGDTEKEAPVVHKTVTVLKTRGEFKIEDITMSNAAFRASIEEMVPGRRYSVDVSFQPPEKKSARQSEVGEMIIHTDDPTEPLVTVKLIARSL